MYKQSVTFFLTLLLFGTIFCSNEAPLKLAVLGLGGRSNYLLLDCLKLTKNIQVVAVCDDNAHQSFDFFVNKLLIEGKDTDPYKKLFANAIFYPDSMQGLQTLFENHKDIDQILITSANYHHSSHLKAALAYSPCKKIFIEKPLFRNLQEFTDFNLQDSESEILIGLTLRYSSMARIVVEKLQKHQKSLGTLKSVKAWERIRFSQALTSFMMSWRRYISLSGGLLLEKSIHDLDLALFFIQSLEGTSEDVHIRTQVAHNFFTNSHKQTIINEVLSNESLKKGLIRRDLSAFQRIINFSFNVDESIDWTATIDAIFAEFPESDDFTTSDIIPDYHRLNATINTRNGTTIDFELEVELGGFRTETIRGMNFVFEHGRVEIDVMKSILLITFDSGEVFEFDLLTNNTDHADGDICIAKTILGLPAEEHYTATFNDPVVQLATLLGLLSEQQALMHSEDDVYIKMLNFGIR